LAGATLSSVVTLAVPAAAQAFGVCGSTSSGGTIYCPYGANSSGPKQASGGATSTTGGSGTPSNERWDPFPHLVTRPDGTSCEGVEYRPVPVDTPPPNTMWMQTSTVSESGNSVLSPCPPAEAAAQASAAAIAVRGWQEVSLPVPRPYIAPGRAITGKLAYLETRGVTSYEYSKPTEVGTLEILATAKYTVDWGDGETSWPYSIESKPWPDGEITHDYINVGTYDVALTEHWTATWHLGPWSGSLAELRTIGRIDNFPVQQIQAVIVS